MRSWESMESFFTFINSRFEYVILRNWEQYSFGNMMKIQEDIDILVRGRERFLAEIGAVPVHRNRRRGNFYVQMNDSRIRVDIRYPGDGYYPQEWEEALISNRVLSEKGFYVLEGEHYYYSLLYHALLQKPDLSMKYQCQLSLMGGTEYCAASEQELGLALCSYMSGHGYAFTIPEDTGVFLNLDRCRGLKLLDMSCKRDLMMRKLFNVVGKVYGLKKRIGDRL